MIFFYWFLIIKFYWRDWLVVVYNLIIGGDVYYVWECDGFYKFWYYKCNFLILSVDKSKLLIDKNIV